MLADSDTICAIATPSGKGGVSIIRVSGTDSLKVARQILGFTPEPRYAHYVPFKNSAQEIIDQGVSIFFPGPKSFTGEDVIELQAHGGPYLVDMLLQEVLTAGCRLARPGEFSERAFLNGKIDLAQAEAIADLIDSQSALASRFALRSLQGEFSRLIDSLVDEITQLRVYIEAAIDFPEEEVDFLDSGNVSDRLQDIRLRLHEIMHTANQGRILKEGFTVVIAGHPNAGKSSLLNTLSGQQSAIVTDIAGTTRDTLREHINIDGMPLHIIDTAGLRDSEDIVELEGIKRAWQEIQNADLILLMIDASSSNIEQNQDLLKELESNLPNPEHLCLVFNKIDLINQPATSTINKKYGYREIHISARTTAGLSILKDHLKSCAGFNTGEEGGFIARRRHLDALHRASDSLDKALEQFSSRTGGEFVAEDLRHTQNALAEITGKFTSDDLLGEIFSSFCIGK